MMSKNLKALVKEKYSKIANQSKTQNESSCCGGTGCCSESEISMIGDEYNHVKGYHKNADLGLGCGLPTEFAGIKKGHHVLDLGSGAGNDCFVARSIVGEKGKVTGIDFTEAMTEKALVNNQKLGYPNVEFIQGDIEAMPLPDDSFDVVISNCVLNLVPDKEKAFQEIYRVLKPGGHFCVSDVVLSGHLPEKIKQDAEMYAGCVSGALQKDDYLKIIQKNHFTDISIEKEKKIEIPNPILLKYLSMDELRKFKKERTGIYSITVKAKK
ncbi:MAG: arsenite methyltransferase [Bacteroidales bacterium]|jgi:SAM-dependent methyltransferase|nr:arsenite methyltransferase [Bacteroidales bacterium]